MKSNLRLTNGHLRFGNFFPKAIVAWLVFVGVVPLWAEEDTNTLEIQSIRVNGKSLPFQGKEIISLGSLPENIVFDFGADTNAGNRPLRLCYTLEGFENAWHEYSTDMALTVRFYNNSGDQISQNVYGVTGESTGWTGSVKKKQ